jgi:hypothetical protein
MIQRSGLEDDDEQDNYEDDGEQSAATPGNAVAFFLVVNAPSDLECIFNTRHFLVSFLPPHYLPGTIANVLERNA